MSRKANYRLIFTDYNNMFERTYTWMNVEKETFDMDWTAIINAEPSNYAHGFTDISLQTYMHDHGIFYLHMGGVEEKRMREYLEFNDFNRTHCKVIEHNNIGNY